MTVTIKRVFILCVLLLLVMLPVASADTHVDMFVGDPDSPEQVRCTSYAYANNTLYILSDWMLYSVNPATNTLTTEMVAFRYFTEHYSDSLSDLTISIATWNDELILCNWTDKSILTITGGVKEKLSFSFPDRLGEQRFAQTLCSGDNLYTLVFSNSNTYSLSGDLYRIDLTAEKPTAELIDDDAHEIAPWTNGGVLVQKNHSLASGYQFLAITGDQKEQILTVDNVYTCGLATNPDAQTVYWVEDTILYAATPGQAKQRVRSIPRDQLNLTASFLNGQYAALYAFSDSVSLYDVDVVTDKQLSIKGSYNELPDSDFALSHPDIALYHTTIVPFCAQDVYEEILTGDSTTDLYRIPYSSGLQTMISQRFIEPLTESSILMEDNSLLYEPFGAPMLYQGELYAVPAYVEHGRWLALASGEDAISVPQTIQEALDALASWEDNSLNTGQAYLGLEISNREWTALDWLDMLLTQALLNRNAQEPLNLAQYPEFAQTMELIKTVYQENNLPLLPAQAQKLDSDNPAFIMSYGGNSDLYGINLDTFTNFDQKRYTPVSAPSCLSGVPAQYPAIITVYILNPNSQHKEEAMTYLEWLVQNRGLIHTPWLRTDSEPTLRESALKELAEVDALVGKESDAQIEARKAAILEYPYNWYFGSQFLPYYRENILPHAVVMADPLVERHRMTTQPIYSDFLAQFEFFLNDKCSADQCLNQIQRMADMWWLENS